jgi:hypothetical protein
MEKNEKYIWYACYGSNLLEERFNCYIQGGKPKGSIKNYDGCRNKSLPVCSEKIYLPYELYFAKESSTWNNGGVAFIKNTNSKIETLGRMYLITEEQFIDVAKQETNTKIDLAIDFEKAIKEDSTIFKDKSWYGKLIYLGKQNEIPIFTITAEKKFQDNKPYKNYLKTIIEGIKETFNHDEMTIIEYLINKEGVSDNYSIEELTQIINS